MIDQIICLIAGMFIGSVITMFVIALVFASRRAEDTSGVDEVLDELEKRAKESNNAPTVDIKDQIAGAYNEGYMCGNKEAEKARPQGEWIEKEDTPASVYYCCSNCEMESIPITPFCPWCGADMRKENDNG